MRRLAGALVALVVCAGVCLGGGQPFGPDSGIEADCDIPLEMRVRNTGGSNGAGLCVFASMQMGANYQNIKELFELFEYMKTQPGGGYPAKVDRVMKKLDPDGKVKYRQYQGSGLEFIQEGINSGRPVCVTYGYGEFYNNRTIAHMVLCVGMNEKDTYILDNNDPKNIWKMETPEFQRRFVHPGTSGWALYFMNPPPPPVPHVPE